MKKLRVALYIRVSTEEQVREGYGLVFQLSNLKKEIERNEDKGWVFDEKLVYQDEGVSGTLQHRPELDRMMNDVREKKIDIILVWKVDRLFRNTKLLLEIVEEFGNYDVNFKSTTEAFDSTVPAGNLIFQIFGALAEFERKLIITRTTEGKISSAKDGNFVGGGIPFGYKIVEKKAIIEEDEAKWVRRIFTWFVEFDYSAEKIADILTKRKVQSKTDRSKKKKKRTANPKGYWNASVVRKILQRTNYIGVYYYNKHGKDKHGNTVVNPKEVWIEFACPTIIDRKTFEKAQERFRESKRLSNSAKNLYLFSGKITCGECGATYTGYTSSKKTKNYRCGKNNPTKNSTKCSASQISEQILENAIWSQVKDLLQNPKQEVERLVQEYNKNEYYQTLVADKTNLEKRIQDEKFARKRVKEAFRDGIYTNEELKEELAIVDGNLDNIGDELNTTNAQLQTEIEKEERILSVEELSKEYHKKLNNLDYENQRFICQKVIKRILIRGNDINLELQIPRNVQDKGINKSKHRDGGAR
jgi:site-specific DNA recombinase